LAALIYCCKFSSLQPFFLHFYLTPRTKKYTLQEKQMYKKRSPKSEMSRHKIKQMLFLLIIVGGFFPEKIELKKHAGIALLEIKYRFNSSIT